MGRRPGRPAATILAVDLWTLSPPAIRSFRLAGEPGRNDPAAYALRDCARAAQTSKTSVHGEHQEPGRCGERAKAEHRPLTQLGGRQILRTQLIEQESLEGLHEPDAVVEIRTVVSAGAQRMLDGGASVAETYARHGAL
jgi:hypothetical protein